MADYTPTVPVRIMPTGGLVRFYWPVVADDRRRLTYTPPQGRDGQMFAAIWGTDAADLRDRVRAFADLAPIADDVYRGARELEAEYL